MVFQIKIYKNENDDLTDFQVQNMSYLTYEELFV